MKIHGVEQGTDEWFSLRAGIPTASRFSDLVTSKGEASKSLEGYATTLAGEKYAGKPLDGWEGNKWTDRGHDLEGAAISLYEFANDIDVERVGFVTADVQTVGCSPDGMVMDRKNGVEVKCLKAENHIKAILYFQKNGTAPTTYITQVQGQILICGWEWCDLLFYHPDLPLLTIRHHPDPAIQKALSEQIPIVCARRDDIHAALIDQAEA